MTSHGNLYNQRTAQSFIFSPRMSLSPIFSAMSLSKPKYLRRWSLWRLSTHDESFPKKLVNHSDHPSASLTNVGGNVSIIPSPTKRVGFAYCLGSTKRRKDETLTYNLPPASSYLPSDTQYLLPKTQNKTLYYLIERQWLVFRHCLTAQGSWGPSPGPRVRPPIAMKKRLTIWSSNWSIN